MNDEYCGSCMTEARRICEINGQNVSETYRLYHSGTRHLNNCLSSGVVTACGPYETPEAFADATSWPTCPCGLKNRPGSCGWCEE